MSSVVIGGIEDQHDSSDSGRPQGRLRRC
jgi:hypothetical protein